MRLDRLAIVVEVAGNLRKLHPRRRLLLSRLDLSTLQPILPNESEIGQYCQYRVASPEGGEVVKIITGRQRSAVEE
jgi:hypothetical protein